MCAAPERLIAPSPSICCNFQLLTGVVIVEKLFNYKGFGWTLVEAANNDIDLLLSCSLVSVVVVLLTQLIWDIDMPISTRAFAWMTRRMQWNISVFGIWGTVIGRFWPVWLRGLCHQFPSQQPEPLWPSIR